MDIITREYQNMSRQTDNFFFRFLKRIFLDEPERNPQIPQVQPLNQIPIQSKIINVTEPPRNENQMCNLPLGDKEINETIDSFTLINEINFTDDTQLGEFLISLIDKDILTKIRNKQEFAYQYDKTGIELIECCVCYEENVNFVPLKCKHILCLGCKDLMSNKNINICPICRDKLEIVDIQKFFAVIIKIDDRNLGIIYLPPIYFEKEDIWKEHELFLDAHINGPSFNKFIEALTILDKQKYKLIYNSPVLAETVNEFVDKHHNYAPIKN
jgi:hypothetical protein